MPHPWSLDLGANPAEGGRWFFRVWAPAAPRLELHVFGARERVLPMESRPHGYHQAMVDELAAGALYRYRFLDGTERADPVARSLPQGVHGPSATLDPGFPWSDDGWHGLPLERYVVYELHTGTFTQEGTFDAVIPHLEGLRDLGVTAIELMPVAQFPGTRNWGYDGASPFAVQDSYGGPEGLKRLVDACHRLGMALVLDVVYNHLGPEGNYLATFGPYFTDAYHTPWGPAINFDGPESDGVQEYFIKNALYWFSEYHADALRLDAIHAIHDRSASPFLARLAAAVRELEVLLNRRLYLIAETSLNDPRFCRPPALGGMGLDAQWNDDFHHALRTLLTEDRGGYYEDFGDVEHLAQACRKGYVYTGQYARYWRRRRGAPPSGLEAKQMVVFGQNHDQAGNRLLGERLGQLTSFEGLKLAAACVLLSPFVPLLFMGEEYGETAPFLYFVSHGDPELISAVRKGRQEIFRAFGQAGEAFDPQDEATFLRSKLDRGLKGSGRHRALLEYHRELLHLRTSTPALSHLSFGGCAAQTFPESSVLAVERRHDESRALAVFNFSESDAAITLRLEAGCWRRALDSAEPRWEGPGSALPQSISGGCRLALRPRSAALYIREAGS